MMRVAILALTIVTLVAAQQAQAPAPSKDKYAPGVPVPTSVDFENGTDWQKAGWKVKITPPAVAGKNFESTKAAKSGEHGLLINVTTAGANTSYVEAQSPWWKLAVEKRYLFKVGIKSVPALAAPVTVALERRSGCCKGKVVAITEVEAGAKYDTFSLSYLNKKDADYMLVIGVGKMVSTYRIDDINITTVARKMSDGKAGPAVALGN